MLNLGTVKPGSTIYIPFDSFAGSTGASITLTGLAVTDIEVYKNGSVTQRSSDTGYTLLDTDGIDFDGLTGIHGFSIDLASNADAGFYAAGADYFVVVSSVTIDTQTVSFVAARFRIGYEGSVLDTTIATLSTQTSFTLTAGPAEDDALNGMEVIIHDVASAVQLGRAVILDYTGSTKTVTLAAGTTFTAAASDNISVMGPSPLMPTTAGRTFDVTATGAGGVDWGNVENQSTSVNLSATTTNLVNTVTTLTNLPAITANWLTAAGIADGAIDRATFAADTGLQTIRSNTAQAGSATGITLDASASATTSFYLYAWVYITGGTGAGQVRPITSYDGGTKVATVLNGWSTTPDATSTFAILPFNVAVSDVKFWLGSSPLSPYQSGVPMVDIQNVGGVSTQQRGWDAIRSGTIQASSSSSITLDASASAITDYYKGNYVCISDSSDEPVNQQVRLITAYNGTTKVATIAPNWRNNPGVGTTFVVLHASGTITDVEMFGGTAGTFSGGRPEVNTSHAAGTAWNSGAIGANTIANDAITDAKIAVPAETAGRPTRILAMLRRSWEWVANKRIRTRATGVVQLRNDADNANLETATQSTAGGVGAEVDTQTEGA